MRSEHIADIIKVMGTDLRQSPGWAKYLSSQGWIIEKIKVKRSDVKVYVRRIPLLGSVVKIQRPAEIPPIKEIDRVAKKYHALFVKLEPLTEPNLELLNSGFELDSNPNLPTKTLVIDLTKNEEELWKELSQDARQSIRKAKESKLQISHYKLGDPKFEEKLKTFYLLLRETGRRQKFWTPRFDQLQAKAKAFGKSATFFIVYADPQTPVAGAFVLNSDSTHFASSQKGKQLYAPYLLLWETIRYLKKRKLSSYDLAGVYDSRFHKTTQKWQGFTTFKRKFGGEEITYPRPLIKYYSPIVKILSRISPL